MSDTQRLLTRARRRGDLPVSGALLRAGSLVAALACLPYLVDAAFGSAQQRLRQVLLDASSTASREISRRATDVDAWAIIGDVLGAVVPFVLALAVVALLVGLAQTGGWFGWSPGRRRSAGHPRWAAAVTGFVGVAALLLAGTWLMAARLGRWTEPLAASPALHAGERLTPLLRELGWLFAAVALLLGVADRWWASKLWRERNELSRFDERRERREREASPEARQARRSAHRELAG